MNLRHVIRPPILVKPAETDQEFHEAVSIRVAAFDRHYTGLAAEWGWTSGPEEADRAPQSTLLIAIERDTGRIVGSVRVQRGWEGPLTMQSYVDLPDSILAQRPLEITRLAVEHSRIGNVAKMFLWKALWLHGLRVGANYFIVVGSVRKLERIYRRMGFVDVIEGGLRCPAPSPTLPDQVVLWVPAPRMKQAFLTGYPDAKLLINWPHPRSMRVLPADRIKQQRGFPWPRRAPSGSSHQATHS